MSSDFAAATGLHVLERGWLSSNNVLVPGKAGQGAALIDTGHRRHAEATLTLVEQALAHGGLAEGALTDVAHTHLHSDHCGGTAALQQRWAATSRPAFTTWVPEASRAGVDAWASGQGAVHAAAGQDGSRFTAQASLRVGSTVQLGGEAWSVHAAPGHDDAAVMLLAEGSGTLLAGDALWADGFGVVFGELDPARAASGFRGVEASLDCIESLQPAWVVPGHGSPFSDLAAALARARARLQRWRADPARHALHAARVLIKFHVMERGTLPEAEMQRWLHATPLLATLRPLLPDPDVEASSLLDELIARNVLGRVGDSIVDV